MLLLSNEILTLFRFSGEIVKSTCNWNHGAISYVRDSHYDTCTISQKEQWYSDEVVFVSYSYQVPKPQGGITNSCWQQYFLSFSSITISK